VARRQSLENTAAAKMHYRATDQRDPYAAIRIRHEARSSHTASAFLEQHPPAGLALHDGHDTLIERTDPPAATAVAGDRIDRPQMGGRHRCETAVVEERQSAGGGEPYAA